MSLQAILFDKYEWTKLESKQWMKENNYKPISYRTTHNLIRYRLKEPIKKKNYRIIPFGHGIQAVYEF
jgi:hypothetical protein